MSSNDIEDKDQGSGVDYILHDEEGLQVESHEKTEADKQSQKQALCWSLVTLILSIPALIGA